MDAKRYFSIVDGPSKDRIFDACRYAHDKGTKISLSFKVALSYTSPGSEPFQALGKMIPMQIEDVCIEGIRHENKISDVLIISGSCNADLEKYGRNAHPTEHVFEAYYKTSNREGTIVFDKQ